MLAGGDRRSLRGVHRVVGIVTRDATRVPELVMALKAPDAGVAARAADAIEKVSRRHADFLDSERARIIRCLNTTTDAMIRWNLIQILPRLHHGPRSVSVLIRRLSAWFWSDDSVIVRVCALTALADLARQHHAAESAVRQLIQEAQSSPFPAVRSRARRLGARR
jgi:hypothetical protein